ncbi:MAG: S6 family peptidase, partial [Edwardsiella sp. (in: enterobacteria)]
DYGVMASRPRPGDSGSPVFGWDAANKKWVLVAVHAANGGGVTSIEKLIPGDFFSQVFYDDRDAPVRFDAAVGRELAWTFDSSRGIGALTQGATAYSMHGQQGADLNSGKNLVFLGPGGLIDLKNSVSQGAGSLTFRDDYRVTSSTGSTWHGAGIIVDKDASVQWQVNGVQGDNLHKIGEGTLVIQGAGVNEGGLKVGEGTVVLQQQTDKDGRVQAFDSVNIASGRPTVVLSDHRQVNPDNISWGYHGGTLDINGNSLTFHRLQAADYGAVLANNAAARATVTMDFTLSPEKVALNSWSGSRQGTVGGLYEYRNPYANTTDYFILKTNAYGYFPTDQRSSDTWEYLGNNLADAQKQVADRKNAQGYLYHGQLKGNLNLSNVVATGSTGKLVLDGSAEISGSFTQENGRLTLQGHPVIHAYNDRAIADKLAAAGDTSVRTQPTAFDQEDWENRTFTFGRLVLKNTDFGLGRNATLNTAIEASNSVVTLGDDRVFIDQKEGAGTDFRLSEGISAAGNPAARGVFNGSATLSGNSQLNIVNATFNGDITGYSGTHVQLSRGGIWNMTKDASLDVLQSRNGGLSLVTDTAHWTPKTLTVNSLDASSLRIGLGVNTSDNTSDRIDILNQAMGGSNILDMSYLFDQTVPLTNDLTLASAPAGTSHGYFSFASLNRGFTVYTPDTQVVEKDGRVQWQLKHSAIPEGAGSTTPPAGNGASGSTGSGAGGSSSGNTSTSVNGEHLFRKQDNTALLKQARSLFAAREYLLSDHVDNWEQIIDYTDAQSGAWAMTGYSHGGYDAYTVKQNGLDFGFRKHGDAGEFWGTALALYDGDSRATGFRDDYRLWGVSLFAGQTLASGLFVDGSVGYQRLSERFSVQGELSDLSGNVKSHIATAGARLGWRISFNDADIAITPSVSVNGARIDGNHLQGNARSAEMHAGGALWLKAGVMIEKDFGPLSIKSGLFRNITLNEMPGITLTDNWKARRYNAERADRYIATVGVDGSVTENLRVQLRLSSSFDGKFTTDGEGGLGIRYSF